MRLIFILLFSFIFSVAGYAQELNAKLTLNTRKIPAANKDLFSSMETAINQLLNDQKWTTATFNRRERIDCSVTISINEMHSEHTYSAEIQITARRPVYNSTYVTTLINYRDTQFEFSYTPGQSMDYSNMNVDNNLVAVISYYVNIILGLDFDSFSQSGGAPYFAKAMEIANMAQSLNTKGWEPFSGRNSSRYDLAVALTDEGAKNFHSLWYNYYRTGLDEMAANPSRGRIRIIESLNDLKQLYDTRPSSPLVSLIGEAKLEEIVRVCSQATTEEKQSVKRLLNQIFPTKGFITDALK
jgi:hypothetical protein